MNAWANRFLDEQNEDRLERQYLAFGLICRVSTRRGHVPYWDHTALVQKRAGGRIPTTSQNCGLSRSTPRRRRNRGQAICEGMTDSGVRPRCSHEGLLDHAQRPMSNVLRSGSFALATIIHQCSNLHSRSFAPPRWTTSR